MSIITAICHLNKGFVKKQVVATCKANLNYETWQEPNPRRLFTQVKSLKFLVTASTRKLGDNDEKPVSVNQPYELGCQVKGRGSGYVLYFRFQVCNSLPYNHMLIGCVISFDCAEN